MKKSEYHSVVAELSILYEISSLLLLKPENFSQKITKKVARLFGVRYFVLFTGTEDNCQLVASSGFKNPEDIPEKIESSQTQPNQFHFSFGEAGLLFMEKSRPLTGRERRIYTVFAWHLQQVIKRIAAVETLRKSEEKYRSLIESADDPIYLIDKDYRYISVNNVFLSRLGLSEKEVLGKTFGELHSPEESKEFAEKVNQVFETGKVVKYESYNKHLDRWTIRSLSPIKDPHMGEVIAISIIAKDITERKKAEEERLKTEENFREVIENIFKFVPEGLLVFTDKLNLLKENKAFQDIVKEYSAKLNYTEQELREIIIEQVKNRIVKEDHGEIRIAKKQDR